MTEKVWGLTPRWDGTQGFTQWVQIIFGWFMGLMVLAAFVSCGVEEYNMAREGTRYEVTYIEIADGTKVKCMYDNSWNETFACDWKSVTEVRIGDSQTGARGEAGSGNVL